MATVHHWTGLEARALRLALRLSVRAFAQNLGLAVATVSKWEKLLSATEPRPDTQAILDTALGRADASVHLRFETLLSETAGPGQMAAGRRVTASGPRAWEYESWTDDLDRAVVALSRQNFTFADSLLGRWLSRFKAAELDDKGLYLYARSTARPLADSAVPYLPDRVLRGQRPVNRDGVDGVRTAPGFLRTVRIRGSAGFRSPRLTFRLDEGLAAQQLAPHGDHGELTVDRGAPLRNPLRRTRVERPGVSAHRDRPTALGEQRDRRAGRADGPLPEVPAVGEHCGHGDEQRDVPCLLREGGAVRVVAEQPLDAHA